jgi:hypothetical protein
VKFRSQIENQVSNYRLLRASTVDIGGIVDHCCLNFHFIIAVNWLEYFLNGSLQMFFLISGLQDLKKFPIWFKVKLCLLVTDNTKM